MPNNGFRPVSLRTFPRSRQSTKYKVHSQRELNSPSPLPPSTTPSRSVFPPPLSSSLPESIALRSLSLLPLPSPPRSWHCRLLSTVGISTAFHALPTSLDSCNHDFDILFIIFLPSSVTSYPFRPPSFYTSALCVPPSRYYLLRHHPSPLPVDRSDDA